MNTTSRVALSLSIAAAAAAASLAGPITPPPGPVAPTYKTLDQVEPRTPVSGLTTPGGGGAVYNITQPGSYYLTGSVTGLPNAQGIRITASDVTLDLGGFALIGVEGSFRGIDLQGELENITITNGVVRGWGNHGVDGFLDVGCTFRGLKLVGNGRDGLNAGARSTVIDCTAEGNNEQGIDVGHDSLVRGCIAATNAQHGIRVGNGAVVSGCTARANAGSLNAGIQAGSAAAVTGCVAADNEGYGIRTGDSATITGCTATSNDGTGIYANVGSTIADCTANANLGHGIDGTERATITGCTALGNGGGTGAGIRVFFASTITGCTVSNSSTGILADSGDNRIDSNNILFNTRGISLTGGGCFVVRNSLSGNNTSIFQGGGPSAIGAVLNVSGATISTSNAWANFEY